MVWIGQVREPVIIGHPEKYCAKDRKEQIRECFFIRNDGQDGQAGGQQPEKDIIRKSETEKTEYGLGIDCPGQRKTKPGAKNKGIRKYFNP